MRKLKRWLYSIIDRIRLNKDIEKIKSKLKTIYNTDITFTLQGNRGADNIYKVLNNIGQTIAVVRVTNKYKEQRKKKNLNKKVLPFKVLSSLDRLKHEYTICEKASKVNLTPRPTHLEDNYMVVEYIEGISLQDILIENPKYFWPTVLEVNNKINELHKQDISHMDMSFNNILKKEDDYYFIDFEYTHNNLTFSEQKVYDYLRLLESIFKFIPHEIFEDEKFIRRYVESLDTLLNEEDKNIDFHKFDFELKRILSSKKIRQYLVDIFKNLKENP